MSLEQKKLLSVVIPCYNEEECLPYFYKEIKKVSADLLGKYSLSCEFIFVDDGSKDKSLNIIKEYAITDARVRYLSFSRNFGKEAAIYAGLQKSKGDYITLLDVDLQDPPVLLLEMYPHLLEGYDMVSTYRENRKGEPIIRSFFAKLFYKLMKKICKMEMRDGARDFRLFTRQVKESILSLGETKRFSKGVFCWVGFRNKWVPYKNKERVAGKTKWSFWKLFQYSIEGFVSFSTAALTFASYIGLFFCVISIAIIFVVIAKTLLFGNEVAGWASLVCCIFFVGGIQLFCLGIVGKYLANTYLESKNRPIYLERESNIKD